MIDMTPEQSRGYNLRLKMERDARLQAQAEAYEKGFEEGLEEARAEGMLVGRVKLLQELNGDSPGTTEDLLALGTARLHAMEEELQHRLRDRG